MSNDYFNEQFSGQSHGLARVTNIIASLRRVAVGFGKFPTEEQLKTDSTTSAVATGGPTNFTANLSFAPASLRRPDARRAAHADAERRPVQRGGHRRERGDAGG